MKYTTLFRSCLEMFLHKLNLSPRRRFRRNRLVTAVLALFLLTAATAGAQTSVPAGSDLAALINSGQTNLSLEGNAVWNSTMSATTVRDFFINGNGRTIDVRANTSMIINLLRSANMTINDATVISSGTTLGTYLIGFGTGNYTSTLNLEGTTFDSYYSTLATGGGIIYAYGDNHTITIDGGTAGVVFSNNRSQSESAGAITVYFSDLTINGKVTFDSNRTGNYGGAVALYDADNKLTFNGETSFTGNHSVVFGGALDLWGGNNTLVTFNGPTTFSGNYVRYQTAVDGQSPPHVVDQNPRGGAINIGYVGLGQTSVVFNDAVTFSQNRVISTDSAKTAMGGAISVYGNGLAKNYQIVLSGPAVFEGNYAVAAGGKGDGGAIFYDSSAALLQISSGSRFLNNSASRYGGAVYLQSGTIQFNAAVGDITFQGNRQGVTVDAGYAPTPGSGKPNAIYLGTGGNLDFMAGSGHTIHMYDPIASAAGSSVVITKTGGGEVVFYGDGGATSDYNSLLQASTTVSGGYFTLTDGVQYGSSAAGTVKVQTGGTFRGGNNARLLAKTVTVAADGALGANGGLFTVDSADITFQNGSFIRGSGTLAATSAFKLTGQTTAEVSGTDQLDLTAALTGTGGLAKTGEGTLILSAVNTYTGSTDIQAGTLTAGAANVFAQSGQVSIASGATLNLNNFDQTAKNLSGAGTVTLGSAQLTVESSQATTFSGLIEGGGGLTKTGPAALTLSGANNYSGGTTIEQGRVIITDAKALGTEAVSMESGGELELALADDGTVSNQLSGSGAVYKTGSTAVTLTAASGMGSLTVSDGELNLASSAHLTVSGAYTQSAAATLAVELTSGGQAAITAGTAQLDGTLKVSGVSLAAAGTASDLENNRGIVIQARAPITGDFSSVDFGGSVALPDYLVGDGQLSDDKLSYSVGIGLAWKASADQAHGTFTLPEAGDSFNVDVPLNDRTGITPASGWDGKSLTKLGAGELILSAANTYTGTTSVQAGTLTAGAANVFAQSGQVSVASGATLNLNNFDQLAQNLSGAGTVTLGSARLTVQSSQATTFSGVISDSGSLIKTGAESLTLSGANTYTGGTDINGGRLIITNAEALGTGTVTNNSTLELALTADGTVANQLAGSGTLIKSGATTATLGEDGDTNLAIEVNAGTLKLAADKTLSAASLTTASGATTDLRGNAVLTLSGAFTQSTGATLNITVGNNLPVDAASVTLGGALNVEGLAGDLARAKDIGLTRHVIIQSDTAIQGDFASVDFGGASSGADYLLLNGRVEPDLLKYSVGFALAWTAGRPDSHGTFTLPDAEDRFIVDVALADESANPSTGWDGQSLTKKGAGELILSETNGYTGTTDIQAGTLTAGAINAFAASSGVAVATGATLNLNNFDQLARNLSGGGTVTLGTAQLTVQSSQATTFSGVISDSGTDGSLVKTGTAALTLSGANTYSGGTAINGGSLIITNAEALGTGTVTNNSTLELALTADGTVPNELAGSGTLIKSGATTATLGEGGDTNLAIEVNAGTLKLAADKTLSAASLTTASGATTDLRGNAVLTLSGAFTQSADSTLNITVGNNLPITAASVTLDGALNVEGLAGDLARANDIGLTRHIIIQSDRAIQGDFDSVDFGGASSGADYLILDGQKDALTQSGQTYSVGFSLAWLASADQAHGTFTLPDAEDSFIVDVVLGDRTDVTNPKWDGKSLTKKGAGKLILEAVNTYTGKTDIQAGTLTAGAANVFLRSSEVEVAAGAILNLNDNNQTAQNLNGAGTIILGKAQLTVQSSQATTFSGVISDGDSGSGSGPGSLVKTGPGSLTLSGANTYSGGTTISEGRLIITNDAALGTGTVDMVFDGKLELALTADGTVKNVLSGNGAVYKTGTGTVTLSATGSSMDFLSLEEGGLALTGANGLTVYGIYTQSANGNLIVTLDSSNAPVITARSAELDGSLSINGFTPGANPTLASELASQQFTVITIDTSSTDTITGNYTSVAFNPTVSTPDYLTLGGHISDDQKNYIVGLGLSWYAAPAEAHGTFTLADGETFNVNVALNDRTGTAPNWDGASLTKLGTGTLILSVPNAYSGTTNIQAGILTAGAANVFAKSSEVEVAAGATLNLNGNDQTAQNLSGAGAVNLGTAVLTATNSQETTFSGTISGSGSLVKTELPTLTLSGANTYSGGTTISEGVLIITNAQALGTGAANVSSIAFLMINLEESGTVVNQLSGEGIVLKTGTTTATLTSTETNAPDFIIEVVEGTLNFGQSGEIMVGTLHTDNGATTQLSPGAFLEVNNDFYQSDEATLSVGLSNSADPVITAGAVTLGGKLFIDGFDTGLARSSVITASRRVIIKTGQTITGDFNSVDFGGQTSGVDFLLLNGRIEQGDPSYTVGFELAWTSSDVSQAHGTFTLPDNTVFEVDTPLNDRTGITSGWDGESLTKLGMGTLILSAANTYTGATAVNAGLLLLKGDGTLGQTSSLAIASGAQVDLNGTGQTVGLLNTADGSQLNFNGGQLTIDENQRAGGTANSVIAGGTLIGGGGLTLSPATVTVTGANPDFTGDVAVTNGSKLTLNDTAGLGTGYGLVSLIKDDDALIFDLPSGALQDFAKGLTGHGLAQAANSTNLRLTGDNSGFNGRFEVDSGAGLTVGSADNLGFGQVDLSGTLTVDTNENWTMNNLVNGDGLFVKTGPGQLAIHDNMSDFTGRAVVRQGALIVGDPDQAKATLGAGSVEIEAAGILSGLGVVAGPVNNAGLIQALNGLPGYEGAAAGNLTVGPLTNSGIIALNGSAVGNTLTVTGGLTGSGGRLVLNTVLGGDDSLTDRLILDGGRASGTTEVVILNQGGAGGATGQGIMVVSAINGAATDADAFRLSGASPNYRAGMGTVVAGAYDYSLLRGGHGGDAESWYLVSSVTGGNGETPVARPETATLLAGREAALDMFRDNLYDRLMSYRPLGGSTDGLRIPGAVWGRLEGGRTRSYADHKNLKNSINTLTFKMGMDLAAWSDPDLGSFAGGLMFGLGRADIDSEFRADSGYRADGKVNGYSAGLYGTWFQHEDRRDGFYVDAWLKRSWFDHRVKGRGLPSESFDSRLWSASLEGGYSAAIYQSEKASWSFDPSFQAIYNRFSGGPDENSGARVGGWADNSWTTRLGGRLHGRVETESGVALSPYLELNWLHNTGQADGLFLGRDEVLSNRPRNTGELKLGLAADWGGGLSATVGLTGESGSGDFRRLGGQVGLRYEW